MDGVTRVPSLRVRLPPLWGDEFEDRIGVGTLPGAPAPTIPSLDLRTTPFSQIGMAQTTDYERQVDDTS
jgi:hypothetical protein